jgi:hypothetical protein
MHAARRRGLALGLALLLTGCATPGMSPEGYAAAPPDPTAPPPRSAAEIALSVLATPVFFVFKIATCASSMVLATPAVAITGVTDPSTRTWERQRLYQGVASNCAPPYVLP